MQVSTFSLFLRSQIKAKNRLVRANLGALHPLFLDHWCATAKISDIFNGASRRFRISTTILLSVVAYKIEPLCVHHVGTYYTYLSNQTDK